MLLIQTSKETRMKAIVQTISTYAMSYFVKLPNRLCMGTQYRIMNNFGGEAG